MPRSETTCWTMIRAAAAGDPGERDELARRYQEVVRQYLAARWRGSPWLGEVDDAAQAVFVECFRRGGVLDAVGRGRVPAFRAFLYGVVRNVAMRFEGRPTRPDGPPPDLAADDPTSSQLFDRAWARAIMAEAGRLQRARAEASGPEAVARVELLRLRFEENRPIREIARLRGVAPPAVHKAYALARREFRQALLEVVAFHHPGSAAELAGEAARLLEALS